MLNKLLTTQVFLKSHGETKVAARLDSDGDGSVHVIITEPGERIQVRNGENIQMSPDKHYLIGEIADRLYAYEQLGYSPEELKKIIEEPKRREAMMKEFMPAPFSLSTNCRCVYVTTGRQNGKTALQQAMYDYIKSDIESTRLMAMTIVGVDKSFQIKNVIFNDPATIVFWQDGTKTVVKATNEDFDPEKGLAMAISKKALGNKHDYYNVFKKWLKKWKKNKDATEAIDSSLNVGTVVARAANAMKKLSEALTPKATKEGANDGMSKM